MNNSMLKGLIIGAAGDGYAGNKIQKRVQDSNKA